MAEWTTVFADVDACVTPVLEPHELATFDQIVARDPDFALDSVPVVPVFSDGPTRRATDTHVKTEEVLRRAGVAEDLAHRAAAAGIPSSVTGLSWPPL